MLKRLLVFGVLSVLLAGCMGVMVTMRGPARPPRGPARIIWKAQSGDLSPGSYTLIATLRYRTTWCGITKARNDKNNHATLARRAGELGADAILLTCGGPGTAEACHCWGKAVTLHSGAGAGAGAGAGSPNDQPNPSPSTPSPSSPPDTPAL